VIPLGTLQEMFKRGAIYEENSVHIVDYYIVKQEFPAYLEELALQPLSDFEKQMYYEGYVAYIVRDDGLLEWKPTGKQFRE